MLDILNKIGFTTLLLVYLFVCGSLYIISYWSTFEFDITNYIELFDIPKSFAYPLAAGVGVSVLSLIMQGVTISAHKTGDTQKEGSSRFIKWKYKFFYPGNTVADTLVVIMIFYCIFIYDPYSETFYRIIALSLMTYVIVKTLTTNMLSHIFPAPKNTTFN